MCLSKKQKDLKMLRRIFWGRFSWECGGKGEVGLAWHTMAETGGLEPGLTQGFSPCLCPFLWLNAKIILL